MNNIEIVYDLKKDIDKIRLIQQASIDKHSQSGLKIENGLLYGSIDWFEAINNGEIETIIVKGLISKIYMSGHNDFPEFEVESEQGKFIWTRLGQDNLYKIGKRIEITYVEQKFKRPIGILGLTSKCVLDIKIEK